MNHDNTTSQEERSSGSGGNEILISCPLCDASEFKERFKLNSWQLVECLSCGFVYVNPRPPVEVIEQGYRLPEKQREEIPFNLTATYQEYYTDRHEQNTSQIEQTILHLLKIANRVPEDCRLLDLGCGNGTFLECAVTLGLEAYGCDLGDWMKGILHQKNLMSRVYIGNFYDAPYPDEFFDIIHASAVLGHLYAPRRELKQLRRKLKSDGILALMSTPNIDSIFIRLGIDSFDGNVPLTHLSYFSKNTLIRFLQQQGFQPMFTKTWGVPLRLTVPPYLTSFKKRLRIKDSKATQGYYQSDKELNIDDWQDVVIHSPLSRLLKKLHLYDLVKKSCNVGLNLINGGQVVDVIAIKQ